MTRRSFNGRLRARARDDGVRQLQTDPMRVEGNIRDEMTQRSTSRCRNCDCQLVQQVEAVLHAANRQVTKNLSSIRAPWVFNFTLSINTIFIFGTRETFVAGDRHKAENERERRTTGDARGRQFYSESHLVLRRVGGFQRRRAMGDMSAGIHFFRTVAN